MRKLLSGLCIFVLLSLNCNFAFPGFDGFSGTSYEEKEISFMPPNPEVYPEFYEKSRDDSGRMRASAKYPIPRIERAGEAEGIPAAGAVEKVLVIPVYFSDEEFDTGHDTGYFNEIMLDMKDYFQANSQYDGTVGMSVDATVVEAVYSDKTMVFYGKDKTGGIDEANGDISELAREAVQKLDTRGFNFEPFDKDGNDIIDHLFIIHAGLGQEESTNSDLIWSHRWEISGGGEIVDGVKAFNYAMVPETGQLGTFAHEFGHDIGLPDLYDTDGYTNGITQGVGDWDIMGSGSWNHKYGEEAGTCPANLSAWSRMYMGWIEPAVITQDASKTLSNTSGISDVLKFWNIEDTAGTEYYLSEYRRKLGYDEGLPGEGLLIWHIDQQWIDSKFNTNTINAYEARLGIELEQADGDWDLWHMRNRGDYGDPFPGTGNNMYFSAVPYRLNYSNINKNLFNYVSVGGISTYNSTASAYYEVEPRYPRLSPSVLQPDDLSVVGTKPTFIWGMAPQAEYYVLQISEDIDFESEVKEYVFADENDGMKYLGDGYEFTISDSDELSPDTEYYWRITGVNASSNEYNINWGNYRSFRTIGAWGNTWSRAASMPTVRDRLCTVELDGKIYALGGSKDYDYSNKLEVYDPIFDSWSTRSGMITARMEFGAAAANGKIYVFGGYNGGNALDAVEEYDHDADAWTSKANMPIGMRSFGTAVVGDKIYIVGGYNESGISDVTLVYDTVNDIWQQEPGAPTGRHYLGAASVNDKVYAIGGYNENISGTVSERYLHTVEEYDPIAKIWTTKADMPIHNTFFGICSLNNMIYVMGGSGIDSEGLNLFGTVYEYNPEKDNWSQKTSMNTARYGLASASANDRIYAIGGSMGAGGTGKYLGVVEAYEPDISSPSISFSFDGANACRLIGMTPDMEYSLDGGVSYTPAVKNGQLLTQEEISSITADNDIRVRIKAAGGKSAGADQVLNIIKGTDLENVTGNDTKDIIQGITSKMEFSTNNTRWTLYNNNLPDLSGNITIYIRYAATGRRLAGTPSAFVFTVPQSNNGGNNGGSGGSNGGKSGGSGGGGGGGGGSSSAAVASNIFEVPVIDTSVVVSIQTANSYLNDVKYKNVIIDISKKASEQSAAIDTGIFGVLREKGKGFVINGSSLTISFSPDILGNERFKPDDKDKYLKIVAGALNDNQRKEKTALLEQAEKNGLILADNNIYEFNAALVTSDKQQRVSSFSAPIKITISLKNSKLGSIDTEKLGIYYYNEATETWDYIGGNYDAAAKAISFETNHFSSFAVMEYRKTFEDISNHWAKAYIEKMASRHIAKGSNNSFEPESDITRAEFTSLLVRAIGLKGSKETVKTSYSDITDGKWYSSEINKAYGFGIVRKEDGVTFRPDAAITREEIVVMIARALQYKGIVYKPCEEQIAQKLKQFKDYEQIAEGARESFAAAMERGIVNGRTADMVSPKGSATRAEAIVMIYRLLQVK